MHAVTQASQCDHYADVVGFLRRGPSVYERAALRCFITPIDVVDQVILEYFNDVMANLPTPIVSCPRSWIGRRLPPMQTSDLVAHSGPS